MRAVSLMWLALAIAPAHAFEVDTFKSGMSREQVKEALKSYTFDKVQDFSVNTLIAYDQPEKGSNRQFTFDFCNDKLAGLQQDFAPSNRNLSIIVSNYISKYGQPYKVSAASNVTSIGDRSELGFYWRRNVDVIGIKYNVTGVVEQLLMQYDTANNCWQTPR
jgi:hypothetical protein